MNGPGTEQTLQTIDLPTEGGGTTLVQPQEPSPGASTAQVSTSSHGTPAGSVTPATSTPSVSTIQEQSQQVPTTQASPSDTNTSSSQSVQATGQIADQQSRLGESGRVLDAERLRQIDRERDQEREIARARERERELIHERDLALERQRVQELIRQRNEAQSVAPAAQADSASPANSSASTQDPDQQALDSSTATDTAERTLETTTSSDSSSQAGDDSADESTSPDHSEPADRRIVFTPEQQRIIDSQMGAARNDGRQAAYRYVNRELGVEGVSEAKSLIQEARARRAHNEDVAAEASSKLEEALRQIRQKNDDIDLLTRTTKQAIRTATIRVIAQRLKFKDVDDPIRFLADRMDTFEVDFATMTAAGIEENLQDLATKRPYLIDVGQGDQDVAPAPSVISPPTPTTTDTRNDDQIRTQEALDQLGRSIRTWW